MANTSAKIGVGNNNTTLSVKGVGDALTVSGQAGIKYKDGLGLTAKAKGSLLSGRARMELEFMKWQIEFGVSGDVGAIGAEATIGIFDGSFKTEVGGALGIGVGFVFRVKPPQ